MKFLDGALEDGEILDRGKVIAVGAPLVDDAIADLRAHGILALDDVAPLTSVAVEHALVTLPDNSVATHVLIKVGVLDETGAHVPLVELVEVVVVVGRVDSK